MTESIADGLSVAGLVVGFPLLLLGLMVSLEKLETWGLRDTESPVQRPSHDAVEAAVHDVGHLSSVATDVERPSGVGGRARG